MLLNSYEDTDTSWMPEYVFFRSASVATDAAERASVATGGDYDVAFNAAFNVYFVAQAKALDAAHAEYLSVRAASSDAAVISLADAAFIASYNLNIDAARTAALAAAYAALDND